MQILEWNFHWINCLSIILLISKFSLISKISKSWILPWVSVLHIFCSHISQKALHYDEWTRGVPLALHCDFHNALNLKCGLPNPRIWNGGWMTNSLGELRLYSSVPWTYHYIPLDNGNMHVEGLSIQTFCGCFHDHECTSSPSSALLYRVT